MLRRAYTMILAVTVILLSLNSSNSFAQVSPKKGVTPPTYFKEFQQMIQSEYSKGFFADKFRERKQVREEISQGLRSESTLTTDTVFALTLLGQYTNLSGSYIQQEFQAQLYDGPNPTGTVTDYYNEVSYNQLYFTGDAKGWYDLPRSLEEYVGGNNGLGTQGGPRFVWELMQVSDATLNYAEYIQYYDGQGKPHIGFLAIVHAGAGSEAGANNIWSHRWNFQNFSGGPYTTNDIDPVSGQNVIIDGPYAIMPERSGGSNISGSLIEIGVFAHEFGHIFGLPDLYDTDGSSEGLGNWCLMAGGSWGGNSSTPQTPVHMSAWVKKELGWVTPINITSLEKALSVPNVEENPIVYRMWRNGTITNQYFLIENRQKLGFDTNIFDSGFLIYHVDDAQNNNQNEDHYMVDLEQADGLRNLNNGTGRGDAGDPFPGSRNNTRFDWNTTPKSNDYNLSNTFVSVRNIQKNGNVMIGDFDINSSAFLFTEKKSILFQLALGEPPLVNSVTISNYGFDDLVINGIASQAGPFTLLNELTYPITLATYDSLILRIQCNSSIPDQYTEFMAFDDNDLIFDGLTLNSVVINPAGDDHIYSISGPNNNGNFSSIDYQTGAGTNIGETGFSNLVGLAIHPKTNIAYALISSASGSQILRVNGIGGDTYPLFDLAISNLYSMTFDSSGQLYANTQAGIIYSIDLSNGTFAQISQMPVQRVSIAFNQVDNQLWGTVRNLVGVKDRIIKISLTSGDTTNVGQTGFEVNNNSIVFDGAGNFYGITGTATVDNNLILIDKATGIGTIIGSTGLFDLKAIALSPSITVGIDTKEIAIPGEYALDQNYPNPFNPITQIKFALPTNSSVRITIYNLLGEVVLELVNTDMNSGVHTVQWNADDVSGKKVSSGIYFYELNANGINGNQFNQVRKMILMK